MLIGTKIDLRDDKDVVSRLEERKLSPISREQVIVLLTTVILDKGAGNGKRNRGGVLHGMFCFDTERTQGDFRRSYQESFVSPEGCSNTQRKGQEVHNSVMLSGYPQTGCTVNYCFSFC